MEFQLQIPVTIRFLVNYKQELPYHKNDVKLTVMHTIRQTGISIIYTSMVLIAGFIIFVFSGFGGTQALGWLTSLTLLTATITDLFCACCFVDRRRKNNQNRLIRLFSKSEIHKNQRPIFAFFQFSFVIY